jgi:hypoxanthine phosphoribosyltransferase
MMPSGLHSEYEDGKQEADFIYEGIIKRALNDVFSDEIHIVRETDSRKPGAITRSIIEHIAEADLAIVDITGQNPNVFLELGIRYSLRKRCTILLKQETTVNPFDIHNYRCVVYNPKYDGAEKAREDIREAIRAVRALSQQQDYADSLVFEIYPDMVVSIPDVISEPEGGERPPAQHMAWPEYWGQLERVVEGIRNYFQDGRFVPDAILGISNGGLIFADLLGRELFRGRPVLSLWADRQNKDANFFENAINDSVLNGLTQMKPSSSKRVKILIVDDIVASGNTLIQALNYLKKQMPGADIHFLPLFSRNQKYFDLIKDNVIWMSDVFRWTESDIVEMHSTDKIYLPYNKEIRST